MDGYGKPGFTREEFEREMDAELDAVSSLDSEYKPGGIMVLDGPEYVGRRDIEPIMTMDEANSFIRHMAEQDPERLERDRVEAWGYDPTRHSPDAMVVTYDEK